MNAPSYNTARTTLVELLDGWVFATATRDPVRPDPAKPYFHALVNRGRSQWWLQSSGAATRPVNLAGLVVTPTPELRRGDVVMGRETSGRRHPKLVTWVSDVKAWQVLAHISANGTSKTEMGLLGDMADNTHDVWALARLVLFGNVQAFVDQYLETPHTGRMNLSKPPHVFVHDVAHALMDPTVWTTFCDMVRQAGGGEVVVQPRLQRSFPPASPVSAPAAMPVATYDPVSPTYAPASPISAPAPTSPPYCPDSPPYCPDSPLLATPTPDRKVVEAQQLLQLLNAQLPTGFCAEYNPDQPKYDAL